MFFLIHLTDYRGLLSNLVYHTPHGPLVKTEEEKKIKTNDLFWFL